jgi:hypothetical protein
VAKRKIRNVAVAARPRARGTWLFFFGWGEGSWRTTRVGYVKAGMVDILATISVVRVRDAASAFVLELASVGDAASASVCRVFLR